LIGNQFLCGGPHARIHHHHQEKRAGTSVVDDDGSRGIFLVFGWPIILSVAVVLHTNTAGSYQEAKHSQSSGGNFKKGVMKLRWNFQKKIIRRPFV
jgi:hypothetical protein